MGSCFVFGTFDDLLRFNNGETLGCNPHTKLVDRLSFCFEETWQVLTNYDLSIARVAFLQIIKKTLGGGQIPDHPLK